MNGWEQFTKDLQSMEILRDYIHVLNLDCSITITKIGVESSHACRYHVDCLPSFDRQTGEYVHPHTQLIAGTVKHLVAFLLGLLLMNGASDGMTPPDYRVYKDGKLDDNPTAMP